MQGCHKPLICKKCSTCEVQQREAQENKVRLHLFYLGIFYALCVGPPAETISILSLSHS